MSKKPNTVPEPKQNWFCPTCGRVVPLPMSLRISPEKCVGSFRKPHKPAHMRVK